MAKDWEKGIDYDRLFKQRLGRAQEAIRHAGLGAVVAFNFDNIRYLTGTHIGEWARDKFMRYALCPVQGPPFLWDPAPPAKRLSSPWIADNVMAPISTMQGGLPPQMNVQGDFAKQSRNARHYGGTSSRSASIDGTAHGGLEARHRSGRRPAAMLDAREVKTADEIEL
jgi:Xaa-Pro aminopeptidase